MLLLLTYDIKETSRTIHSELKKELIASYGWSKQIQGSNGKTYDLPNTSLVKSNCSSTQQGSTEFLAACRAVGAQWEKYIVGDAGYSTFDNQ